MWLARDSDGDLHLFVLKPIKNSSRYTTDITIWVNKKYVDDINNIRLKCNMFHEVTFDNSPVEVELKLKL